jgi:hypothetical protein
MIVVGHAARRAPHDDLRTVLRGARDMEMADARAQAQGAHFEIFNYFNLCGLVLASAS